MIIKYKKKRNLLETVFLVEIFQGLALTLRKMFSKPITRQYPDEKRQPRLGFRGRQALVRDPDTGASKCVACLRCATVCPSQCITIEFHEEAEGGRRLLDRYEIEALRCIYCGYCEEVCPVNAVVLTEAYEYSACTRKENYFTEEDLLKNWDKFIAESQHDPASYVNPFWRPRGVDPETLAAPRRRPVPLEWTKKGQIVGSRYRKTSADAGALS